MHCAQAARLINDPLRTTGRQPAIDGRRKSGIAYTSATLPDLGKGLDKRQRYLRVKNIVMAADELPATEREVFLLRACHGDPALRSEVDWLLQAMEEPDELVSAFRIPQDLSGESMEAAAGSNYRLLRQIGRGGMGVVYLAERHLGDGMQSVALKLLDAHGWPEEEAIRRLTAEARILGRLPHPNIAGLLDAGRLRDGRPFLAMQYVEGERIDRWCEERGLSLQARIRLFLKVCEAVEFAHRHLVIHRDLKPANILVDAAGEPKLLDFGIARLLDGNAATWTETAHRALTLSYASPEQLRNEPLSTASDVWQLGVVLYELVTGIRPFPASESPLSLTHAILSSQPPPPSRATPANGGGRLVPGDIDAIVMKALRASPTERYGTVADLASDLRRHLESRPVQARRGQWWYRARRFVHRHRGAVAAGAIVACLLVGFAFEREAQLRNAQQERDKAQALAGFMRGIFEDADPSRTRGNRITVAEALDLGVERLRSSPVPDAGTHAALLVSIGRGYTALDMGHRAIPLLREADGLLAQMDAPALERGRAKAALRRAYSMVLDCVSAIAAGHEAIALLEQSNGAGEEEILRVKINLLFDHLTVGDLPLDVLRARLSETLSALEARPAVNPEVLIQALAVLAMADLAAGEDADATRHSGRALGIARRLYGPEDPALIYYRFTDSLARIRSDPETAVEAYLEQIADYEQMNNAPTPGLGALYAYAGRALANMGRDRESLQMLERAEEIARLFSDVSPDFHLNVLSQLAAQQHRLGRGDGAEALLLPWLDRLAERARSGSAWGVNSRVRAHAVLGSIALSRDGPEKAADHFLTALDEARRHPETVSERLLRESSEGLCAARGSSGTGCV